MQIFTSFTSEAAQLIRQGGIGVIPTDTVYGLVGSLFSETAIERMYVLKNRDVNKPVGTILINDPYFVEHIVDTSILSKAKSYWPNPVSVVIPVVPELHYAHRGMHSLPFRIPDHQALRNFISLTGPLASTSANFAGKSPATTMQEALGYFRSGVDFYIDGGDLSHRKPSTIIELGIDDQPKVIRGDR